MNDLADFCDPIPARGETSPLRTIKFRPLPRVRKTEHVRPIKTIHIAPPPRRREECPRPIKTIHVIPPPRPGMMLT